MKPLEGVRITDLTIVVAGPVGSSVLADLGAEVIKVEHVIARRGHIFDALPLREGAEDRPFDRSSWFHDLNRSKKGVTLDLSVPEAKQALLHLAALSDVLMENFSPRVMGNLGLEYDVLRQVNPALIMVSMPGFGSSGPMRDRTSFGPGIEAMTGLGDLTGYEDGPPLKPGNYVTDYNAGMLAAFSIMAALYYRRRTGLGQRVEIALREGALQMIGAEVMEYSMNGRIPTRAGNRHPSMAPHGVYPCKSAVGHVGADRRVRPQSAVETDDEWIAIAIGSNDEWRALCRVMGHPEWCRDPRFGSELGRLRHRRELDERIAAWTREQDHYTLMHALQQAGVDAGAVLTTAEIARDPHYQERGFFQEVTVPDSGPARYTRYGFQLGRTPVTTGPGPGFGRHNRAVLHDLLGLSDGALAALKASGAIADSPRR